VGNGNADWNPELAQVLKAIKHELEVIEVSIDGGNEHVGNCTRVVTEVAMANAAAAEPAVVVTLQDADVADGAVVGARGAVNHTELSVRPIGVLIHAQRRQVADYPRPNHLVDVRQGIRVQK